MQVYRCVSIQTGMRCPCPVHVVSPFALRPLLCLLLSHISSHLVQSTGLSLPVGYPLSPIFLPHFHTRFLLLNSQQVLCQTDSDFLLVNMCVRDEMRGSRKWEPHGIELRHRLSRLDLFSIIVPPQKTSGCSVKVFKCSVTLSRSGSGSTVWGEKLFWAETSSFIKTFSKHPPPSVF